MWFLSPSLSPSQIPVHITLSALLSHTLTPVTVMVKITMSKKNTNIKCVPQKVLLNCLLLTLLSIQYTMNNSDRILTFLIKLKSCFIWWYVLCNCQYITNAEKSSLDSMMLGRTLTLDMTWTHFFNSSTWLAHISVYRWDGVEGDRR